MRLIQSRSAVAALQFGWHNFGILPSIIIGVATAVPALFTTMSFASNNVSYERRIIGAALTVAPVLTAHPVTTAAHKRTVAPD